MPDSLLQRIATGQTAAVAECLDRYGGLVWSLAERYLKGYGEDLEDACQEVFVEVWSSASRFDPSKGSEAAFVATIAHRRLIDRQRKTRSSPVHMHGDRAMEVKPPVAPSGHAGSHSGGDEDVRGALNAFSQLSSEEQQILFLSLHHGLSHERIAKVVDLPLGTVKSRIRGGLTRLRATVLSGGRRGEEAR